MVLVKVGENKTLLFSTVFGMYWPSTRFSEFFFFLIHKPVMMPFTTRTGRPENQGLNASKNLFQLQMYSMKMPLLGLVSPVISSAFFSLPLSFSRLPCLPLPSPVFPCLLLSAYLKAPARLVEVLKITVMRRCRKK